MKPLLFLTQRIPYPPNKGDKLRAFAILKHLARSWDVHLGCFVDDPDDWPHLPALRPFCADLHCVALNKKIATVKSAAALLSGRSLSEDYFHAAAMTRWVAEVRATYRPEATLIFSAPMGQYAEDNSAHHRLVCDFVDVDSVKWRQYADRRHGPMAWIYHRESARLLDYERKLAARSHAAVFVSEPEAALFRDLAPQQKDRVQVITNGLDHQFFKPDAAFANPFSTAGRAIVMTGAMDYWPNIDAALWFMTEILPPLRAEQPDLQFIVVGSNPTAELRRWNGRDNVTVTGRVDDVRPYLQHAALAVAPMRVARGIQNKVLEGMAMAKPVLSTTAGWEGIDAVPGQHLALADDTDGFVREARRLLADPAGSAALGAAARQRIVERYDWPVALQGFDRLLAF